MPSSADSTVRTPSATYHVTDLLAHFSQYTLSISLSADTIPNPSEWHDSLSEGSPIPSDSARASSHDDSSTSKLNTFAISFGPVYGIANYGEGALSRYQLVGVFMGVKRLNDDSPPLQGVESPPIICAGAYWLIPDFDLEPHPDNSMTNPQGIAADFSLRHYYPRGHTRVCGYFLGGLRIGNLWWDYEEKIEYDGNKSRSGDNLTFGAVFAGIGIVPYRSRTIAAGVNFTIGAQAFRNRTAGGFLNDLFMNGPYQEFQVELIYTVKSGVSDD